MKTIACVLGAVSWLCLSSSGGEILDQSQVLLDTTRSCAIGGSSEQILAQVVTAGLSGSLSAVGLAVSGNGTLILEIEGVSGGIPDGVILSSESILGSSLPDFWTDPTGFRHLELSKPVPLLAGEQFAIVLQALTPATDTFGLLRGPVGDPYPGGDAFFDSRPNQAGVWVAMGQFGHSDLAFETYMEPVPEPNAMALTILASLIFGGLRQVARSWSESITQFG